MGFILGQMKVTLQETLHSCIQYTLCSDPNSFSLTMLNAAAKLDTDCVTDYVGIAGKPQVFLTVSSLLLSYAFVSVYMFFFFFFCHFSIWRYRISLNKVGDIRKFDLFRWGGGYYSRGDIIFHPLFSYGDINQGRICYVR